MKLKYIIVLLCLSIAATLIYAFSIPKKVKMENKGFVLVELFTSEGCSSCPPADQLVAKIAEEINGKPIYILAYHVDYWNDLGWKDPFSNAAYSERQRQYSSWLHLRGSYTPQIVVNGKTEFVGSDEGKLRNALITYGSKTENDLELSLVRSTATGAEIRVMVPVNAKGTLFIACIQRSATSNVTRGENGGRKLSHVNVVRSLQRFSISSQSIMVKLPAGFNKAGWELVGFVQDQETGAVLAAGRLSE